MPKQTPKKSTQQISTYDNGSISIFSTLVSTREYNESLKGKNKYKVYDEMRLSDATIKSILNVMKLPILQAKWSVVPGGESKQDRIIAEEVEKNLLHEMTRSWQQTLSEVLMYLDYGVMPFELVFEYDAEDKLKLKKLSPIHPESIDKWDLGATNPALVQGWGGQSEVVVDLWKLAIFTHNREGDDWQGTSVLRAPYKHWYIKEKYYLIHAMAMERQGMGVPIAVAPPDASPEDRERVKEILQRARANEEGYILLPDGWELVWADMKAGTLVNPEPMVNHHNREAEKSVLAQFLDIGAGENAGGYAQSRNESDLFTLSLDAISRYVAETFSRFVIQKMVDVNYDVETYPYLTYDDVGQPDLKAFAEAIKLLVESGGVILATSDQEHIRSLAELPKERTYEVTQDLIAKLVADIDQAIKPQNLNFSTKSQLISLKSQMVKELLQMQVEDRRLTNQDIAKFLLGYQDQKSKLLEKIDDESQPAEGGELARLSTTVTNAIRELETL